MTENEFEKAREESAREIHAIDQKSIEQGVMLHSASIDATIGASITNYKEFQLAAVNEVKDMTAQQIKEHILSYRFDIWAKTVKMQTAYGVLHDLAAKLTKEEREKIKLSDLTYNPKALESPKSLRAQSKTPEEKTYDDLKKALPHLSEEEIKEIVRSSKSAAFQRGVLTRVDKKEKVSTVQNVKGEWTEANKEQAEARFNREVTNIASECAHEKVIGNLCIKCGKKVA